MRLDRRFSFLGVALCLTLAAGAAGCATPATRPPPPDHPLIVRAEQAMLAGDEDEALKLYRAFRAGFRPSPLESECHYWEGTILLKRGKAADAEKSFYGCVSAPRSRFIEAAGWIGIGDCRFVRDDYQGAILAYDRALRLSVPDARSDYALYRLGIARQRQGEWELGKACYRLLVRDHGQSPLRPRAEQRLRWPDQYLHLQVGAFQQEESAKKLEGYLHQKGLIAKTVNVSGPAPYLVWVGDYPSARDANAAMPEVRRLCGDSVVLVP